MEMHGLLSLYFDIIDKGLDQGWRKTSVIVSKTKGHGEAHAQCIHEQTLGFLHTGELPLYCLGHVRWTVLSSENIASKIKLKMIEKSSRGLLKAENLVNLVASSEMQKVFSEKGIYKVSILKKMATHWLKKLDW